MDTLKNLIKNKYLTLVPINESKEMIKKHEEIWSKIIDLIRLTTKNSHHNEEKFNLKN